MKKGFIDIIRYLLIILWMYAAILKLTGYSSFIGQLKLQPLPIWSIQILSIILPLSELTLVFCLLFQKTIRLGFIFSFAFMSSFSIYVFFALQGTFGKISCACAGIIGKLPWREHLIFNLFFTILAFIGVIFSKEIGNNDFVKHKRQSLKTT